MSPAPDFDASAALARFRTRVERERVRPTTSWTAALAARLSLVPATWMRPAIAALGVVVIATTAATAAAAVAGFAPLAPSSIPSMIPSQSKYAAMGEAKATFQFDEAKARAAAARVNATPPPMPAAVAATTLTMSGGPGIMTQYGSAPKVPPDQASFGGTPALVIVQVKAPVVTSNGATVNELRDYALAQPGIPPSVAAQVRAIGDPVATLLVPIGIDMQNAKAITVRGTQGYLVGDNTGLGSGVVWLERGHVIGVLGTLTESELIAVVNGLR